MGTPALTWPAPPRRPSAMLFPAQVRDVRAIGADVAADDLPHRSHPARLIAALLA